MIEFTKSYKTADGKIFASIEDAQLHEVESILLQLSGVTSGPITTSLAEHIIKNKATLIDVLTTTPNSKPKARTTHGGSKNRKRTVITAAVTDANPAPAPASVAAVIS